MTQWFKEALKKQSEALLSEYLLKSNENITELLCRVYFPVGQWLANNFFTIKTKEEYWKSHGQNT